MKKFALNDEDMQSLKTSLLEFVRRVASQGADSAEEAGALFHIVNLLLGIPVAFELDLDEQTKTEESQESENRGKDYVRECGRSRYFRCTK